jgi:hypothetical protein
MKEPKEFRAQLPDIVRSAFVNRRVPAPSEGALEQLADAVVRLLEEASGGDPVPSVAPFVAASQLVDKILGAKSAIAQSLQDQHKPVPEEAQLLELAARQVAARVTQDAETHSSELAWALQGAQEIDEG